MYRTGVTLKNSLVDPLSMVPYLISVCLARSSALSMGECIRSTVRKAAKLAVYEDMMIRVKNHQTLPTILPDIDLSVWIRHRYKSRAIPLTTSINKALLITHLGSISHPCCMKAPKENQRLLNIVKLLVTVGPSCESSTCHSKGENRLTRNNTTLTPSEYS